MPQQLTDEDMAVLRGLKNSAEWKLLFKLSQSVKGDFIESSYGPGYDSATGIRRIDDSDRLLAVGAARGIDEFMTMVENLANAENNIDNVGSS